MKPLLFLNIALLCVLGILTYLPSRTILFEQPGAFWGLPGASMTASWYGFESCVNPDCLMANGEAFREDEISCASRTHYGKVLRIEYQGKTIECPVKDKISKTYDETRIDLSRSAFEELEDLDRGVIEVIVLK